MAEKDIKKGDEVSWKWGSGHPGGTVAEVKEHGDISIQSKKGNTIKKNASPENPAVHVARSGNDVVKRMSELDKEADGGGGGGDKDEGADKETDKKEEKEEKEKKTPNGTAAADKKAGEKREHEPAAANGTAAANKKAKTDAAPAADEQKAETKKKPGRPKKSEGGGSSSGAAKETKEPRAAVEGDHIGSRTRSRAKA